MEGLMSRIYPFYHAAVETILSVDLKNPSQNRCYLRLF